MSVADRRAMVDPTGKAVSVRRQCALLALSRSGVYWERRATPPDDLGLMRRIDELHLALPFYGSRRMAFELNARARPAGGEVFNRKRVQRLMRIMGIEALVPRPGTSRATPGHKIHPYLLRGVAIAEPNHVWAADITYIPMAHGFLYLVAIIDWASRAVLAWRLSNTLDTSFCLAALEEALLRHGRPKISTPIKARNSPALLSPAGSRRTPSRYRWTGAAVSWTISSSSGCGARSNTKRSI